jgi:hypothetical protein
MLLNATLSIAKRVARRLLRIAKEIQLAIRNYPRFVEESAKLRAEFKAAAKENAKLRAEFKVVIDELARLVAARAPDPRALSPDGLAKVPLMALAINASQAAERMRRGLDTASLRSSGTSTAHV